MKHTKLTVILLIIVSQVAFAGSRFNNTKLTPTTFKQLPSWKNANVTQSFSALKRSCTKILSLKTSTKIGTAMIPINKARWTAACTAALKVKQPTNQQARQFFQQWFTPTAVSNNGSKKGLFTGYYLPEIKVSTIRSHNYPVPIYGRPADLITAKLGIFRTDMQGKQIAGRIKDQVLYPYDITRAQINRGALKNKARVIAWTKYRIDRFILQIQGSGIAVYPSGKKQLMQYNGNTGEAYYPIGRWLIDKKYFTKDTISMQKIRTWVLKHPKQGIKLMEKDKAFVFFKRLPGHQPYGTQQVRLTDGYSLAVDANLIPLGMPEWLDTKIPNLKKPNGSKPFTRLMIAQDTGGAIYGAIRGDIYFGAGKRAEKLASRMKNQGSYWLFIPKVKQTV